jgi:hypothetical protein
MHLSGTATVTYKSVSAFQTVYKHASHLERGMQCMSCWHIDTGRLGDAYVLKPSHHTGQINE